MSLLEHLQGVIQAAPGYGSALPGGVYIQRSGTGPPLGEKLTPDAYETAATGGKRLLCCCVLAIESTPELFQDPGQRTMVRAGLYQAMGYDETDAAIDWLRGALDPDDKGEQYGPTSDGRYYILRWAGAPIRSSADDSVKSAETVEPGVSYEAAMLRLESEWP